MLPPGRKMASNEEAESRELLSWAVLLSGEQTSARRETRRIRPRKGAGRVGVAVPSAG
jgi:hypothetical protein